MKKVASIDTERLLHELQAHQIELERQNEELRQAQEEAAAERDHYAKLYEAAPIGYFTLDRDGRISDVNSAGAALLGLPHGEVVGTPMIGFVAAVDKESYRGFLARLVVPTGEDGCNVALLRADGAHMVAHLDGRLDTMRHEFLIAATDITERWRHETALAAARDIAEQASRAKSAFLANMSHEMRTPLHIIVGLGHLLRRDLADTVQQQRLEQLCANSDHLLDLINDVLDLSRIEAGRLTLDRRPFHIADVLARLDGVIATPARAKGLELAIDADAAACNASLLGDPLRLAQILINLGSNAVKFTERGSIRIAIENLAETIDGLQLRFTVQDSGIGIEPAHQEHLLEVFMQADNSPTRAHGGSGLGLAISQRLVGMMGGRISVESQAGVGSRFSFELVLARGDETVAEAAQPIPKAYLGGRRVMFAEDHPLSQEILFEMLEDLGCEVDVASDGLEALECARSREYDLILMDMQMPKLDGLAATRAIRALAHHQNTPIIALTANAFADDRQRCFDAGMNDHLGKPVTPDTLGTALSRWMPALAPRAAQTECGTGAAAPVLDIPGLNPPASMRGSPQRLAEYQVLLNRFAKLHGRDMQRIEEHLANGGFDDARKLAHDLKGIAGLIGARNIAQLANDIVVALRGDDGADVEPLLSACAGELERLTSAAAALPTSTEA